MTLTIGEKVPESNWTVISDAPSVRWGDGKSVRQAFLCRCACGNESVVTAGSLRRGKSKQCRKCSSKTASEQSAIALTKHGHSPFGSRGRKPTPTYGSWYAMKARCSNPNNKRYLDYAGRGITVCARWQSFENFLSDMGERPEGTTLDRIDVNGNYEPLNCRWATSEVQAQNKRPYKVIDKFTDLEIWREFQRRKLDLAIPPKS